MKKTLLLTAILAAAAIAPAIAADPPIDLRATSPTRQFDDIRTALTTEDYAEISSADRRTVLDLLDRMEREVGDGGVDALGEDAKVRLFNWQEQANVILVGAAEDSRVVCQRVRTVGTRMATTQCATVAERRRVREAAQGQPRTAPRVPENRN